MQHASIKVPDTIVAPRTGSFVVKAKEVSLLRGRKERIFHESVGEEINEHGGANTVLCTRKRTKKMMIGGASSPMHSKLKFVLCGLLPTLKWCIFKSKFPVHLLHQRIRRRTVHNTLHEVAVVCQEIHHAHVEQYLPREDRSSFLLSWIPLQLP